MDALRVDGGGIPMEVQFVASFAPIVRDAEAARAFYGDALGLSFEGSDGEYVFTQKLDGTKHFGLWPLSEAATACFGTTEWPSEIPVPQASIEFEVALCSARVKMPLGPPQRRRRTGPWSHLLSRPPAARRPRPARARLAVSASHGMPSVRGSMRTCSRPSCRTVTPSARSHTRT